MTLTMSTLPEAWARQIADPAHFQAEQERLAHAWRFLGLTRDVAADGDWITASIGSRPVFVQRFGEELRGFENLCAHRGYPMRRGARGNGPLRCAYHHWQYNRDGRAVGIPVCNLAFGARPDQVGAQLRPIEVAVCGALIFGRFPAPQATQSLADFLGDAFPILEAATRITAEPIYVEQTIRANWKLNMHITLEEYHGPQVHPATFGKDGFPKSLEKFQYHRLGANSAFLFSEDPQCFDKLLEGCRNGTYRSNHYFVFQILPDLILSHADAGHPYWYCNIMQYGPTAIDRTRLRNWSYPAPFAADFTALHRLTRPVADLLRRPIYRYYLKKVVQEDADICEHLQEVLPAIGHAPILGAMERRIGWFEESLRTLGVPPAGPPHA